MRLWPIVLVAAIAALGTTSATEAVAGEAEARSFFADGRQKRLAGACEQAIPLFRKAFETYPDGLGSLRNLAECEEELQRYASARRSYWNLRLAAMKTSDPKYAGWEVDATEAHTRLESRVAKVVVTVVAPKSAEVMLNGAPLDPRLFGEAVEQDVGAIHVVLRDGTQSPPTRTLELEAGRTYTIELVSQAPADRGAPAGPAPGAGSGPVAGSDAADPGAGLRTGAIVSFVLTGAGAIGLGISLGLRQSSLSTIETECQPRGDGFSCPSTLDGDVSTGETASTLVNVFAVGTAVAGAAGIGLLVASFSFSPDGETVAENPVQFTVAPIGAGAALGLRGRF